MTDPDDVRSGDTSSGGARSDDAGPDTRGPGLQDPLGVTAIVLGCIGIVAFGFVLCIVTAVVSALAGSRARAAGRSLDNAYIGFGLAALDGIVFIVLHYLFKLPAFAG